MFATFLAQVITWCPAFTEVPQSKLPTISSAYTTFLRLATAIKETENTSLSSLPENTFFFFPCLQATDDCSIIEINRDLVLAAIICLLYVHTGIASVVCMVQPPDSHRLAFFPPSNAKAPMFLSTFDILFDQSCISLSVTSTADRTRRATDTSRCFDNPPLVGML